MSNNFFSYFSRFMNLFFFVFVLVPRILCDREQGTNKSKFCYFFAFSTSICIPINHNPTGEFKIFIFWFPWATLMLSTLHILLSSMSIPAISATCNKSIRFQPSLWCRVVLGAEPRISGKKHCLVTEIMYFVREAAKKGKA